MSYSQFRYTVQLNMENRRCVVVGGGDVALRKTKSLLAAGASVTLIAPTVLPAIGIEPGFNSSRVIDKVAYHVIGNQIEQPGLFHESLVVFDGISVASEIIGESTISVRRVDFTLSDGQQRGDAFQHLWIGGDKLLELVLNVARADERVHDVELNLDYIHIVVDFREINVVLVVADAVSELR